jgi:hypothetical protein
VLALKVKFKAETVADWKPAEQKKSGKGKENKKPASAAPADGEKSEIQKKRHAKKAEKASKKASHNSEEAEGKVEDAKDDGPDVSSGKWVDLPVV